MRGPRRLAAHPLTQFERGEAITFRFEGRRVPGFQGEPVAVALYAAGRRVLSRSMRYHRARGLYCATGGCTHCFLRVDGVPNVRSCQSPCEPTTWAEGQNAWPSLRWDLFEAADVAYPRYLDAHTAFARPAWLRRLYLPFVRRMAGFGRVPNEPRPQAFLRQTLAPDVLVVGAGPAGLGAAEAAAGEGAKVLLVDAEERLGGRLRHQPTPFLHAAAPQAPKAEGKEWAREAGQRLLRAGVDVRPRTRVVGVYGERWLAASRASLLEIRPRTVVVATGALDVQPLVPNADRAGVLLPTAAARLLNLHGVAPEAPVLLHGARREALLLARDLVACEVPVLVTDERPAPQRPEPLVEDLRRLGLAVRWDHRPLYVAGRWGPRAVVFATAQGRRRIPARTVVFDQGRTNLGALFQQAGAELEHREDCGWIPRRGADLQTSREGVFAAGSCAGAPDAWTSVLEGRTAGAAAAHSLARTAAARNGHAEVHA